MDFMSEYQLDGVVRSSVVAANRVVISYQYACRVNTPAPEKSSYSRRHRLTRYKELEKIKRAGKRLKTGRLEASVVVSLLSYCRIAVVVAKYGHTVVERNQLRRRLRELVRIWLIPRFSGLDIIVRALPSAYGADFNELVLDVKRIQVRLMAEFPAT